jgi:hypothetical protein
MDFVSLCELKLVLDLSLPMIADLDMTVRHPDDTAAVG